MSFSNSTKFSFFFCFKFCVIEWFYNMSNTKHQKKAAIEKNRYWNATGNVFLPVAQTEKNWNCISEECVCAKLFHSSALGNEYGSKYLVLPSSEMNHQWNWTGSLSNTFGLCSQWIINEVIKRLIFQIFSTESTRLSMETL